MSANRLTETNLRDLDEKIQKEKALIEKRETIRAERAQAAATTIKNDNKSQRSHISNAGSKRPSSARPKSVIRN